jgi:hypothetical protein
MSASVITSGSPSGHWLITPDSADPRVGTPSPGVYVGGAGNDTLLDTSPTSNDVYRWGIGQGNDSIADAGGVADQIEIGAGVVASQVLLVRSGNSLQVKIGGAADVLTVVNFYASPANRIEQIRLTDGTLISTATAAPAAFIAAVSAAAAMNALASSSDPTAASAGVPTAAEMARDERLLIDAMSTFDALGTGYEAPAPWQRHMPAVVDLAASL